MDLLVVASSSRAIQPASSAQPVGLKGDAPARSISLWVCVCVCARTCAHVGGCVSVSVSVCEVLTAHGETTTGGWDGSGNDGVDAALVARPIGVRPRARLGVESPLEAD